MSFHKSYFSHLQVEVKAVPRRQQEKKLGGHGMRHSTIIRTLQRVEQLQNEKAQAQA